MEEGENSGQQGELKRVILHVHAPQGSSVSVAGTFNEWDALKNPLRFDQQEGVFTTTLLLTPGRYEYKFVVNGVWCVDPECPNWAPSGQGSLNSVMHVE